MPPVSFGTWRIAALIVLALAILFPMFNCVSGNVEHWVMPWFELKAELRQCSPHVDRPQGGLSRR
jgi:hypothetical protein